MLLPISWLKDLVDLGGIDLDTLEKSFFNCGLEVEERRPAAPGISHVVVGEILSCEKMEQSEHLQVCHINCGPYGEDLQIVTGAQNIQKGDHVPVAINGATVHGRDGKITTIKNGKLLGVPSNGMLCSGEELGIDDAWYEGASVYGILILEKDTVPGTDVLEVLDLNDEVWDISITANLPHCQSVYGLAREISAYLKRDLKALDVTYTVDPKGKDKIGVRVDASDLCPRYIGHYVKNIQVKTSPRWMRRRLILTEHNPINTIVDITNYVLTELGQPMHAFDLSTLEGEQIIVRRAGNGEKITTLDEKEFTLTSDNLVICDAKKPVALAGIMGGLNSEIRDTTKEVLFECAKFARDNIRHTSRALGQNSDSSHRFEKGVDEYTTELAMDRALHLICELDCGTVTSTRRDARANPEPKRTTITTTFTKVNAVLGIEVPKDTICDILTRMNYDLKVNGDQLVATAAAYREDIEDYPDLAEDVIKMYGYEHIVPRMMTPGAITAGGYTRLQSQTLRTKEVLAEQGYFELINYSFYSQADLDLLKLAEGDPRLNVLRISNPISENYSIMRSTLIPSLLSIVSHNIKRKHDGGRFFELANIFVPQGENVLPKEIQTLTIANYGEKESFFTLKGALEAIEEEFGLHFTYERTKETFLHPGATAKVLLGDEVIGVMGQVSYEVCSSFEIGAPTFVCELNFAALSKHFPDIIKYVSVSKFPPVERDLALVCDEITTCGEIEDVIRSACKNVTAIRLFDIFRSEALGAGKKSMAFGLTFTPQDDQPLSPENVDKMVDKICKSLAFRLKIALR